ncbi:MAG TPA: acyltransferase [Pyrinomonadaceae bacterium]|nr:acyltransferase [Pyrinomonadaceae bacterium]
MDNFASRHVPELDGLRGIAILSVLIHHQLTPFFLQAGFLGVDLFFVLSGFLITGLLLAEFDKTDTISLKKFYMRRLLRLGPALTVYLIACLVVAHNTKAIDLTRQLKLVLLALAYATNWRMAFGWDTALDPTAIIWSLSIEEQFYLVWPLLVLVAMVLRIRRRYIASAIGLGIIAVVLHRYVMLRGGADFTRLYYGTDTRADALLIGCLTALLPVSKLGGKLKSTLNVLGILSLVGLIYSMMTLEFTDRFLYQGGFALVALLCACLVLVSAYDPPRILAIVFGWAPLRWLGRISYGLYLWHWLVVRNTSFYTLGKWEPWARLALALTVASASYYFLEQPFNKLKRHFAGASTKPSRELETVETQQAVPALAVPLTN